MKMLEGVKITSRLGQKGGPAKVVGEISIEQFETIAEATQFLGSEEEVLGLINTQYATNMKNKVRALANVTISDRKLREMATDRVIGDKDCLEELMTTDNPTETKERLVTEKMAEIQAELDAKRAQAAEAVAKGTKDEDEDEDEDD